MNVRRLNPDVCGGSVVSFITVSAAGERSGAAPKRLTASTTATGLGSERIGAAKGTAPISAVKFG
jgi:hypothetical protein